MRRFPIFALSLSLALFATGCKAGNNQKGSTTEAAAPASSEVTTAAPASSEVSTAAPASQAESAEPQADYPAYDSLKEAEKAAGFSFSLPDTIVSDYQVSAYQALSGKAVAISYTNKADDKLILVKSVLDANSKKKYSDYDHISDIVVDSTKVYWKENSDGDILKAYWLTKTHVYNMSCPKGLNVDYVVDLVRNVTSVEKQ